MVCIIARIMNGNAVGGYRLVQYDYDKNEAITKDIGIAVLKDVMQKGFAVKNAALISGEIVGTNGSLNRIATFDVKTGNFTDSNSPLVILYKLGDIGYVVSDKVGNIRKWPIEQVIEYSKEYGIANGKVVVRDDGTEFVSAINGEYETKEIKKRVRKGKVDKSEIVDAKERRAYATIIKSRVEEVEEELDFVDPFRGLSPQQKDIIEEYYTFISVEIYKELKRGVRLQVSPKKVRQLAELRGTDDWHFVGFHISSRLNEKCSLGHNIKNVYLAGTIDEDGEEHTIKFGSTCCSDFFDIDEKGISKLAKMATITSSELKIITDAAVSNSYEEAWNNVKLLRQITERLKEKGQSGVKELTSLFGTIQAKYLIKFLALNVPYPATLCRRCIDNLKKVDILRILDILEPEYSEVFRDISRNCASFAYSERNYGSYLRLVRKYLEFLFRNQLEGVYSYDPINKVGDRGKGKFTKEARYIRKMLLGGLKTSLLVSEWDLTELDKVAEITKIKYEASKIVNSAIKSAGYQELDTEVAETIRRGISKDDVELRQALMLVIQSLGMYEMYFQSNSGMDLCDRFESRIDQKFIFLDQALKVHKQLEDSRYTDVIELAIEYRRKRMEDERNRQKEREEQEKAQRLAAEQRVEARRIEAERMEAERIKMEIERQKQKHLEDMLNNIVCTLDCKYQKNGVCEGPSFKYIYINELATFSLQEDSEVRLVSSCKKFTDISNKEPDTTESDHTSEDSKEPDYKLDILEKIEGLLNEYPNVDDYSIDIVKDIIRRKVKYEKLTYKQSYIVKRALKLLMDASENGEKKADTTSVNVTKQLKECEDVKNKVDKIYNYINGTEKNVSLDSKEVAIVESVRSRGKFSTKQLKYIESAYEKISSL